MRTQTKVAVGVELSERAEALTRQITAAADDIRLLCSALGEIQRDAQLRGEHGDPSAYIKAREKLTVAAATLSGGERWARNAAFTLGQAIVHLAKL